MEITVRSGPISGFGIANRAQSNDGSAASHGPNFRYGRWKLEIWQAKNQIRHDRIVRRARQDTRSDGSAFRLSIGSVTAHSKGHRDEYTRSRRRELASADTCYGA